MYIPTKVKLMFIIKYVHTHISNINKDINVKILYSIKRFQQVWMLDKLAMVRRIRFCDVKTVFDRVESPQKQTPYRSRDSTCA